jgi:hypothetical protein
MTSSLALRPRPDSTLADLVELLDTTHDQILRLPSTPGLLDDAIAGFERGLADARLRLGERWPTAIADLCRPHLLCELLLADPLTARARAKPRGYAGDAVMLELTGSPPMPIAVDWPRPRAVSWPTTSYVSVPERDTTPTPPGLWM